MDPLVGVLGDYSTNPSLLNQPDTAVGSGAVRLDLPTTYVGDGLKLSVDPSVRYGDSRGYSSVASNYEHLSTSGEFDSDRTTLTANAAVTRDSSLSYDYLANGAAGVRRDGETGDLNWDYRLTERIDVDVDANYQRVLYAEPLGFATLTDYKYSSAAPSVSWTASERDKLTFSANVGRYDSLGTRDSNDEAIYSVSRSANIQIGFLHQISAQWTLSATGGFSRALNRLNLNEYLCCTLANTPLGLQFVLEAVPVQEETAQNGSVYLVSLTHQSERFGLSAVVSRQLTPTGFAFLSRQESYQLKGSYTLSDRWSFTANAQFLQYENPPVNGASQQVNVQYYSVAANWAWTERLTLSLSAARVSNDFPGVVVGPQYSVASNEVTLSVSRQFDHFNF